MAQAPEQSTFLHPSLLQDSVVPIAELEDGSDDRSSSEQRLEAGSDDRKSPKQWLDAGFDDGPHSKVIEF